MDGLTDLEKTNENELIFGKKEKLMQRKMMGKIEEYD